MRRLPPLLFALLAVLFAGQATLVVTRSGTAAAPTPTPSPTPSLTLDPSPTPSLTLDPTPSASPTPTELPVARIVGGVGAWIDTYDFGDLSIPETIAELQDAGVRTLYLQTGRWRESYAIAPEVAAWLPAAKDAGLEVVGWYVPSYRDLRRDTARAAAIATYRSSGARFDAVGIDIEYREEVSGQAWNDAALAHAKAVREKIGRTPLVLITPPPLQMEVAPDYWRGFPWVRLASWADAWVLMAYWDQRDCAAVPDHCPEPYARVNAERFRTLANTDIPLHLAGGVASEVTQGEVADFVRGASASDAVGVSLYDIATQGGRFWGLLRTFARV